MITPHLLPLAALGNIFGVDGLVILLVGLLVFGRRLPEVGKNLGKTIVEFKKGLSGGYSDDDKHDDDKHDNDTGSQGGTRNNDRRDDPPARRLSTGTRVSVNENLEDDRPVRTATKRLPQTEEV